MPGRASLHHLMRSGAIGGMTYRTTVTMTAENKRRIEEYATKHGATISGATVALAVRMLNILDEGTIFDQMDDHDPAPVLIPASRGIGQ